MSKNVLIRATQLVSSLSPQEKLSVVNLINSTRNPNSKRSKLLELFEAIIASSGDPIIKNRKLLELLEERILDSLLLSTNLFREGKYKNQDMLALTLQKEQAKSRLLYSRGVVKRSYEVAESCLVKAKESESYDTILALLHQQVAMTCIHQNEQVFFLKVAEIDYFETARSLKMRSIRMYRELRMKKYHNITENLDIFVEFCLAQLSNYLDKSPINTIESIRLFFEKEQYELEGNVIKSLEKTIELYDRCQSSPECTLVFNIYELVYEQARLGFELGRVDESIFFLEKCSRHLPMENVACQKSNELLFLIYFLRKDYGKAEGLLIQIKASEYYEKLIIPAMKARYTYYESSLHFARGRFSQCIKSLTRISLSSLKDYEKLRIRLLVIMVYIETHKLDEADWKIDSTRKFIQRKGLQKIMSLRGMANFFECLKTLKSYGYDFKRFKKNSKDIYSKMAIIKNKKTTTAFLSTWLVQYDQWMLSKLSEEVHSEDYQVWQSFRRESYYNTGVVSRIYV